jgi:hypothetical protein
MSNETGAAATLVNTIVAGNTGPTAAHGPDVSGTFTSGGHNLIGIVDGSTGFTIGQDLTGTATTPLNALLGTLVSNGGPTQTLAPLTGSPAIAHGDPAVCHQSGAGTVGGVDQRGFDRPTFVCAIGAFEPLLSTISPATGSITGGDRVTLTGAGYGPGASVTLGGVACTGVQLVNSTTVTCVAGAHATGAVDVVVTVGTQTGTLAHGYSYGSTTALPGAEPSGGTDGAPNPEPGTRPVGPVSGTAPKPLPTGRP